MRSASSIAVVLAALVSLVACGSDDSTPEAASPTADESESSGDAAGDGSAASGDAAAEGLVRVSPADAAATIDAAPPGLVILDVRTPEEFAEAHIDGAMLLDFYRPDFADELGKLDRDVPYVLYCRSGSRSEQAFALMRDLGFESVQDVDGGIVAWIDAGLPVATGS